MTHKHATISTLAPNRQVTRATATLAIALFVATLAVGGRMTQAADTAERCTAVIARIDGIMQRAKVTGDAAKAITQARGEAMAFKVAGNFAACTTAAISIALLLSRI